MRSLSCLLCVLISVQNASAQAPTEPAQIPIVTFAQLPVMKDAELSPDGNMLAYIRPLKGRGHLVIQNLAAAGQPFVIAPTKDTDFRWLHWANEGRLIFSLSGTRKRGGTETLETRLWAVNGDGSNSTHIVLPARISKTGSSLGRELPPAQLQDNVIHWLPDDPHHILVSLDGDQDAAAEVRKIDVRDGRFIIQREGRAGIQDWLADQSGELRFGWGYKRSTRQILTRGESGRWRSAQKADWWDAGNFPLGFTDVSNVAYVRGSDENGYAVIRTMEIESGQMLETVFARDGLDVSGLVIHPVTRRPAGFSYVDHQRKIHYFDEMLANLQAAIDKVLPDTVNRIVSMTSDQEKVLIFASSDVDPGTYFYLNRESSSLSIVANTMPGLAPELMSEVEPVSFQSRDGTTIPAYLTVPLGVARENLKVVVLPHGGPGARDDKSFWFLSQFLASRGYAIFQPNYRGSTGYGDQFEVAGKKEWGGKMQEDVTDGALWLISEGIADPDKLCIVGWSYGGYSAAIGAVQTPDLYQCAASINGVLDLPRLIADDRHYIGGSAWTKHVGLEDESAKLVSPYHQAERIKIPMLIVQAQDDARVHADQGKRMARRLDKLKKPVTYVEVELGGHSMMNEAARLTILQSLEKFLGENLGDD